MAPHTWRHASVVQALLLATASIVNSQSLNFDFPSDALEPVEFAAAVDPEFVKQTAQKAGLYRPTIELVDTAVVNAGWYEGPPQEVLKSLAKEWAEDYEWDVVQDEINGNFSHYAITIPEGGGDYEHPVSFHFVHERSAREDAIPILLLHGWPSTHLEFEKVIAPLACPEDPDAPAFHVVVPDLPGYGFSPAPTHSGLGSAQMGLALDKLMKKLGYEKYGLMGTDLGWFVALFMGQVVPDSLIGFYADFSFIQPNATDLERLANGQVTEEERVYMTALADWLDNHYIHGPAHSLSPLAIAQAMTDSPVGFAGWMWHLMHPISDSYPYTLRQIITNAMMLFIQGTYGNIRLYREIFMKVSLGMWRFVHWNTKSLQAP
jgi:pimeloyl-ACP methyl ester carboxylesterase